ncbi:tRNA dihydrouridine synthase [Rhabdochlamydiaceae symbiont of Dictyostelium giganteum]|uniref:tRNA dihydrouridine synthase n=1 Tax=Rhabdochlamydiaceae symbiont of Dictyostelium giganteum TaxID=3342349 RepID=UPI00384A8850
MDNILNLLHNFFMTLLPSNPNGCPYLFLAPMEGVADPTFRKAIASIGGFNEAVTEFIRVPQNAHVASLAKGYDAKELGSIPLAAQVMGANPEGIAEMGKELEKRGAKRIDLNCGCPSNTVVGKGAGSSLLKNPSSLYQIAHALVKAVDIPVTVKMRSGYEDTSLIQENLLAAEESGIAFLTLHPRTKVDGYGPPAKWEFIAYAKSILTIPVVGNGDILTAHDAHQMLKETKCDALMVGRGSVINPFIFQEIQASFEGKIYPSSWDKLSLFLDIFAAGLSLEAPLRNRASKLKQLFSFLFRKTAALLERKSLVLTQQPEDLAQFLQFAKDLLKEYGDFSL